MLSEQQGAEFRCWNSLSEHEFDALRHANRPLEGCDCTACRYQLARGLTPIPRADLHTRDAA